MMGDVDADPRVIEARARVAAGELSRQRLSQIRQRVREELEGGRPYRKGQPGASIGRQKMCRVCGQLGHIAVTCYRRKREAERLPQ